MCSFLVHISWSLGSHSQLKGKEVLWSCEAWWRRWAFTSSAGCHCLPAGIPTLEYFSWDYTHNVSELGWEPWCSELNFRTPYWKEVVAARLLLGLPTNGPGKAQVLGPLPLVGETGLEFLAPGSWLCCSLLEPEPLDRRPLSPFAFLCHSAF